MGEWIISEKYEKFNKWEFVEISLILYREWYEKMVVFLFINFSLGLNDGD